MSNLDDTNDRLNQFTIIIFTAIGIGIGISLFQPIVQNIISDLHPLIQYTIVLILVILSVLMLFRTLISPIKYHKEIRCTLLFDEQKGDFVNAGWYKSFYFPQSAAGQILSACYDIDRRKSSDYIEKMISWDSANIRELAEYLIVFWMRSTATPTLMSCGDYTIVEFHDLSGWIRKNFFVDMIQSSMSNEHEHLKNPQLLIPNLFRLESSDLGKVRFVASWGDLSITANPLSVLSLQSYIWPQAQVDKIQSNIHLVDIKKIFFSEY